LAEIDRNRSRSNSGWFGLPASSSTRSLNASQDSSRLMKRLGEFISILGGDRSAAASSTACSPFGPPGLAGAILSVSIIIRPIPSTLRPIHDTYVTCSLLPSYNRICHSWTLFRSSPGGKYSANQAAQMPPRGRRLYLCQND